MAKVENVDINGCSKITECKNGCSRITECKSVKKTQFSSGEANWKPGKYLC